MAKDKAPRGRRIASWAASKFNGSALGQVNHIMLANLKATRERARPVELDKQTAIEAYEGRYADGGREKFAEAAAANGWMREDDLDRREKGWRLQARLYFACAPIILLCALAWMFVAPSWFAVMMLMPALLIPLAFLAVAIKADYSAWQIRERRFGGLREYFGSGKIRT